VQLKFNFGFDLSISRWRRVTIFDERVDINSYAQTNNIFDWHQLGGIVTFRPRAAFARKRIEKPPRRHGALVHSADAISSISMLIPLPCVSPRDFTGSGSTFSG